MNKPLTETEIIRSLDEFIADSAKELIALPEGELRTGSLAALLSIRIALRDGDWRPKKTNVVSILAAKKAHSK